MWVSGVRGSGYADPKMGGINQHKWTVALRPIFFCFLRFGKRVYHTPEKEKPLRGLFALVSGERGIRTPGPVTVNGFQDRRNRPLCHLSAANIAPRLKLQKSDVNERHSGTGNSQVFQVACSWVIKFATGFLTEAFL